MNNVIRPAEIRDHQAIVDIYNAAIPGRMATADLEPVSLASRREWFAAHTAKRPLWVLAEGSSIAGWLGLQSFYGRPAYDATVEVSVYVAPEYQGRGVAVKLLQHAISAAPALGVNTILGFVFGHNAPSLAFFQRFGFATWAHLPRIALLDGIERDLLILGKRLDEEVL